MTVSLKWMMDAACTQTNPDMFFPNDREEAIDALKVCATCRVTQQCLEYAKRNGFNDGVWGGKTPRQRRDINRPEPLT